MRGDVTEASDGRAALRLAYQAALAARKETFLASYPRLVKVVVAALLLFALILPLVLARPEEPVVTSHETAVEPVAAESGAESPVTKPGTQAEPSVAPAAAPTSSQLKSDSEKRAAAMNDGTSGKPIILQPAPDMALVEETSAGLLPKVSVDGRQAWQVYARPFDFQDPRPKIAIVIMDLGMSRVVTDAALRLLPPSITLAFDTQAPSVDQWLARARQDGHETLLSLPMEPLDYPDSDPGPNSLLTTLPNSDNIQRLQEALRLGTGYVGVTSSSGSRFLSDSPKVLPVMQVLHDRGLMVLDVKVAAHTVVPSLAYELNVPCATGLRQVDALKDAASIDRALSQLEQSARLEGAVVGIASPLPVTLERIKGWAEHLSERGLVLAPLTAMVK
ncbi:MAG: divergent polysaccharide deacetylase family protein [Bdellovibrionales bacterium]